MRIPSSWIVAAATIGAVGAGGCIEREGSEMEEKKVSISELPGLRLLYEAHHQLVMVVLQYDADELGGCAVLGPDFGGRVNDTPLGVSQRGRSSDPCIEPTLMLMTPPTASAATVTLGDQSRTLTIDLGDLLLPRSIEMVPDGPWHFSPYHRITVRWSPATDLMRKPKIWLAPGPVDRPFTTQGDLVTFTMPGDVSTDHGTLFFEWSTEDITGCPNCVRWRKPVGTVSKPFTFE